VPPPAFAPHQADPSGHAGEPAAFSPAASPEQPPASLGGFVPVGKAAADSHGSPAGWAAIVVVQQDGTEGERFPFVGTSISIGRTVGEVRFGHDGFLSPLHAKVELDQGVFWLVDAGSRNGAYLRIRSAEAVYPGDLFLIGHQLFRLENLGDDEQERTEDSDGTRPFGSPIERAWAKVQLIGGGGASGDTYFLRGTQVLFGRESGEIIFPHDAYLSRTHARLRMEVGGGSMSVYLEDLDSANGTYLRIRGRAEIRAGDMFRVGDQILRLRVS
jgi:pSer/pThr/pTyr-binding forkhead associated (FHA) protein